MKLPSLQHGKTSRRFRLKNQHRPIGLDPSMVRFLQGKV